MTDDEYTPSLDAARKVYAQGYAASVEYTADGFAEFDRMIEAVRREEREKAAQIADTLMVGTRHASWDIIADEIREQGENR